MTALADVPPDLASLVTRLLAKDPAARLARADDVLDDLPGLGLDFRTTARA